MGCFKGIQASCLVRHCFLSYLLASNKCTLALTIHGDSEVGGPLFVSVDQNTDMDSLSYIFLASFPGYAVGEGSGLGTKLIVPKRRHVFPRNGYMCILQKNVQYNVHSFPAQSGSYVQYH